MASPNSPVILQSGFLAVYVDGIWLDCYNNSVGPFGYPYAVSWWCEDPSIVSFTTSGSHYNANGLLAGFTLTEASTQDFYYYDDGMDCYSTYFTYTDPGDATVVSVAKIQYQSDSSFVDISSTLYVLKGTPVTFKAIPDPSNANWPNGKPVWGGTAGATGTGDTKQITFNTLSQSTSDYKTVTAESGNTITVYVVVYELVPQLTPQDNFSGRSATDFGIAEWVNLTFTSTPVITQTQIGELEWIDADSNLINNGTTGTGTYFAPMIAGAVTLDLQINTGPSKNQKRSSNRNIVTPSGAYMTQVPGTGIRHTQNTWSVGFLGDIYLLPKNVSFGKLEFSEGAATATTTGYLNAFSGLVHNPGPWLTIGSCDINTGCKVNTAGDQVWSGQLSSPYSAGTFNWPIPWQYRKLISGAGVMTFFTANHYATADSIGTAMIQKAGAGPFSRVPSDPTSNW